MAPSRNDVSVSDSDDDEPPQLVDNTSKVPLTILTGYLGAGKSTLLEYILNADHGKKIAVIMNEFGDSTDVEAKSITVATDDAQVEEWLEMNNGCLCCSVRDTGMLAIQSLMQKKGKFDQILLETTGLADPGPIVQAFWDEPALCMDITLDSVLTVVDAVGIQKQLRERREGNDYNEAQRQIAIADVVLLNKVDLATPAQVDAAEQLIRTVNSTAVVHRTTRASIPLSTILDLNIYADTTRPILAESIATFRDTSSSGNLEACNDSSHEGHNHGPTPTFSHSDITTVSIPLPNLGKDTNAFESILRELLWKVVDESAPTCGGENEVDILRTKGLLNTSDGKEWVLQGVRELFEIKEVPRDLKSDPPIAPKLILIGRGLRGVQEKVLKALQDASSS